MSMTDYYGIVLEPKEREILLSLLADRIIVLERMLLRNYPGVDEIAAELALVKKILEGLNK
jgi:hypothetical protein